MKGDVDMEQDTVQPTVRPRNFEHASKAARKVNDTRKANENTSPSDLKKKIKKVVDEVFSFFNCFFVLN
jgi:hypothetical protein